MRIRNVIISVMLAGMIPLIGGCALFLVGAGVAAGVGAVAYVNGELRVSEEATVNKVYNSCLKTMSELQFKVTDKQTDALAGKVLAKRADGTNITISFKRQTDTVTEIRIRVGVFGDESLSRLIHEKIKKNL
jgi:hypothetical protein